MPAAFGCPRPDSPDDHATQLLAHAADLEKAAAELQAKARQVRSGAAAGNQADQANAVAFWNQQVMPSAWYYASSTTESATAGRTTVMLRNIPNNYTRAKLLELLDKEGFLACYDFIYLPMDFKRNANLGYAFLNLVSA